MKILFRVDAGGQTGLGHFFRSLALAEKLKERGHSVYFISQPSDFWKKKKDTGFDFPHFQIDDSESELKVIRDQKIELFFVDGIIEFKEAYLSAIKAVAKVVFYQNISDSRHLADVFILPSVHQGSDFFKDFGENTKVYQGLEYFTFNPIISTIPQKAPPVWVRNIAITSGGSDPANTLLRLLDMIDFRMFYSQKFTFYPGSDYQHADKIPGQLPYNVSFETFDHRKILENDLLIGAFGVSIYEFLALNMPVLAFGHQQSTAWAADVLEVKTGALISLGDIDHLDAYDLNDQLRQFVKKKERIVQLYERTTKVLDLKGVERVAEILEETAKNGKQ